MLICKKLFFLVFFFVCMVGEEVVFFLEKGYVNFVDEVMLGIVLLCIINVLKFVVLEIEFFGVDVFCICRIIDFILQNGYIEFYYVQVLFYFVGILVVEEFVLGNKDEVFVFV